MSKISSQASKNFKDSNTKDTKEHKGRSGYRESGTSGKRYIEKPFTTEARRTQRKIGKSGHREIETSDDLEHRMIWNTAMIEVRAKS